jgi:hypothetical protein
MRSTILGRLTFIGAIVLALTSQGLAHNAAKATKVSGSIDDYVEVGGERWHASGEWSLLARGGSDKGDFSLALHGVPRDSPPLYPVSMAHTHHVSIADGVVTVTKDPANGKLTLTLTGPATITSQGNLMGASGSVVTVTVTGGTALRYSNVAVTFSQAAIDHFGSMPYHGVVTQVR